MKVRTIVAIAATFAGAPLWAQSQDAASASAKGRLDIGYNGSKTTPSPSEKTPLHLKAVKIRDMLLGSEALRDRRGFALGASVQVGPPGPLGRVPGPDVATGSILLRFINVSRSKPNAQGEYPGDGEGPTLTYWINDFKGLGSPRASGGRNAFTAPNDLRTEGGVTTYSHNGTGYTMLHKPGHAPFRPLTTERFYQLVIAEDQAGLAAGGDAQYMDYTRKLMETAKAELAALTPKERAAQACEASSRPAPCGSRNALPLTELDPAFFSGKPKNSAQVITFQVKEHPRGGINKQLVPLRAAFDALDLGAVQAMLD